MDTSVMTEPEVDYCDLCGQAQDPDDMEEFTFAPGRKFCYECARTRSRGVV